MKVIATDNLVTRDRTMPNSHECPRCGSRKVYRSAKDLYCSPCGQVTWTFGVTDGTKQSDPATGAAAMSRDIFNNDLTVVDRGNEHYNDRGDLLCNWPDGHEFSGGLCTYCTAPETVADTDAAIREFYRREDERLEVRSNGQ